MAIDRNEEFLAHAIADIKSERARFRSLDSTMNILKIPWKFFNTLNVFFDRWNFNFRNLRLFFRSILWKLLQKTQKDSTFSINVEQRKFQFHRVFEKLAAFVSILNWRVIITHRCECRCASSCRFSGGISSHRTGRDTVWCPSGLKDEYLKCWNAWTLCRTACTRTPSPRNARLCVA